MPQSKFSLNNLRLAIKFFVTAWVPILVLIFPDALPSTLSAVMLMGALTTSVDASFRIWQVGDDNGS